MHQGTNRNILGKEIVSESTKQGDWMIFVFIFKAHGGWSSLCTPGYSLPPFISSRGSH